MLKKFLFAAFILTIQFNPLHGQTPSFYHYATSDGLASSTVFDIMQDKDGYIWFATQNGLSKFNGTKFTTYRKNDGLISNIVTCLVQGEKGEIYIGNYENGLNVLENGSIKNFRSIIDGERFNTRQLLWHKGNIYSFMISTVIAIKGNDTTGSSDFLIQTSPLYIYSLAELPGGKIIALTTKGLFTLENNSVVKLKIEGMSDDDVFSLAACDDGSYYVGARGIIYLIKNNRVIKKIDIKSFGNQNVFSMIRDANKNLWFSSFGKGFFLIPDGSNKIINVGLKMGLQNTLIDGFLEDKEKNIWVITFGKGVYCLNNLYVKNYTEKDGLINNNINRIVKEKSDKLLVGTINGVDLFDNGVFKNLKYTSGKALTGYISDMVNADDYVYICQTTTKAEEKEFSFQGLKFRTTVYQAFCKTGDGLYLIGNVGNSIIIKKDFNFELHPNLFYLFGDSSNFNRVNVIFEDSRKNIWVGTNMGICKITRKTGKSGAEVWNKSFFPKNEVLNSKINAIYADKKNNVWFAGADGIASYNIDNNSVKDFTNISGYDLTGSTSFASDNKNRLWIGSIHGLYMFNDDSVKVFNSQTGLPSNEVLSLQYDDSKNLMFVGTNNGLALIDINLFDKYNLTPSMTGITGVKAGDSPFTDYNNLVFTPEQHDVFISFKALNFSSPASVKYKYKLNHDEWKTTDYDFLDLISLQGGAYELQIMAKSQNSGWGKPVFLKFKILPRFVETIWFDISIISTVLIVVFFVVNRRLKLNARLGWEQLELTERINELKHQALSAMMNPHFIANSLNSVQYLVNTQKYEEANDYIAMMAKLMRKNLDTAGSGFILLYEEISRLKLYLDLEKLRFQESFSYEIVIGNDVHTGSLMIPNMIIQPFVENSLWHGIMDSGNKGLLTVSFTFENVEIDSSISRSLIIKITDNGIGIKEGGKRKEDDHISRGIQIIEERLKLLSEKMNLPKPIMFEDLSTNNKEAHGTEVIISLPPPLYKIIIPDLDYSFSGTD